MGGFGGFDADDVGVVAVPVEDFLGAEFAGGGGGFVEDGVGDEDGEFGVEQVVEAFGDGEGD